MKLPLRLMVLCMGLAGCSIDATKADHYTVGIDPNFSADESNQVLDAISNWMADTSGTHHPLTFDLLRADCTAAHGSTQEHFICIRRSSVQEILIVGAGKGSQPSNSGWTDRDNKLDSSDCYVAMDHVDVPQYFRHIIEHELGHAFGMSHTSDGTLMGPDDQRASYDPVGTDVQQYLSLRE